MLDFILEEISKGDAEAAKKRLKAIQGLPVLELTTDAENLASKLISDGPIPDSHVEDALHIALATTNGMDYLLTWNFNHINNARMRGEIGKIVEFQGYECPVICAPEELTGE